MAKQKKTRKQIATMVRKAVQSAPIVDIHTHLYTTAFGDLLLWGIDELLTYHYLVAEVFRQRPMPYEAFWSMGKTEQAELIWDELFVKHSPVSESNRGVLTTLQQLGIDVGSRNLKKIRKYFARTTASKHIDKVFELANLKYVVMTNNPFDDQERPVWENKPKLDKRFKAALRIDDVLMDWPQACKKLKDWGYNVTRKLDKKVLAEVKRFFCEWTARMDALYMAASLPPTFTFPEKSDRAALIEHALLPAAREMGIPFAMMIGVKKLTNPALQLAGDSVGPAPIETLEALCREFPDNRFLVTYLSRENQHSCCIAARKFHNLMPFGCWWFMNNPSIIDEITRERLELLGLSFIPQHSDARVLDQLIYKWQHSRDLIAEVLVDKYTDLAATGWTISAKDVKRDVADLFGNNFERFLEGTPKG